MDIGENIFLRLISIFVTVLLSISDNPFILNQIEIQNV